MLDTFYHLSAEDSLSIGWDVELSASEFQVLQRLAQGMNYFGRAESLVEAGCQSSSGIPESKYLARFLAEGEEPAKNEELVRLLAPMAPEEYRAWLSQRTAAPKKKGRGKKKAFAPAPSLFEALQVDTADWRGAGWPQPPGSRWVSYARPRQVSRPVSISRQSPSGHGSPVVARYALVGKLLPNLTRAVSIAEAVHGTLVKYSNNAPVFTGKSPEGEPLTGHQHAYIHCELSRDSSRKGISHITIHASMGLGGKNERLALDQLQQKKIWDRSGHHHVLRLMGLYEKQDITELRNKYPSVLADSLPLFATARTWTSLTPFVPTRHPKNRSNGEPKLDANGQHIGSSEHDLIRLLIEHEIITKAADVTVESLENLKLNGRRWAWPQFLTSRRNGNGCRASNQGHSYILTFAESVSGPLAQGYGSHFGLGLFVPEAD